jgi:hypothetical protein
LITLIMLGEEYKLLTKQIPRTANWQLDVDQ